jgi:hypothetical protein
MTRVFDHSQAKGVTRLVLLAIADVARDEDGCAWPMVETIAKKAHCGARTVTAAVHELVQLGELAVDFGCGRGHSSVYTVLVGLPVKHADPAPFVSEPPVKHADPAPLPAGPATEKAQSAAIKPAEIAPEPRTNEELLLPLTPAAQGDEAPRQRHRRPHCPTHPRYRGYCSACRELEHPPKQRPPWCGQCDEASRYVLDADCRPVGRCGSCHPLAAGRAPPPDAVATAGRA